MQQLWLEIFFWCRQFWNIDMGTQLASDLISSYVMKKTPAFIRSLKSSILCLTIHWLGNNFRGL